MRRYLTLVIGVLAAAALACSLDLNIPRLKTGPTETVTINESLPPEGTVMDVAVKMGAGKLNLSGGATGLAEGTINYNVAEWKPTITSTTEALTIEQGSSKDNIGIPKGEVVNDWNLKLGDTPINLTLNAGAYEGTVDLSGLRLRNLNIADGASKAEVSFDSVNPEEMEELIYETGASQVTLTGLANANFADMTFKGGAGSYTLDFSGELQRDATVSITSGVSSMRIVVPSSTAAKITVSGGIKNVSQEGTWTVTDDTYSTGGTGPTLTINAEVGVGSLTLVSK